MEGTLPSDGSVRLGWTGPVFPHRLQCIASGRLTRQVMSSQNILHSGRTFGIWPLEQGRAEV